MHSKFTLRPHHVWKYGRHPISPTAEIRRGKKEDRNYKAMGDHCPVISIDRATIKTHKMPNLNKHKN